MASALPAALRERVVAAIEAGASGREAARRFEVSPASAVRRHDTVVREGRRQAKPMGGDQCSHAIEAQADLIRQINEAQPAIVSLMWVKGRSWAGHEKPRLPI